MGTDPHQLLKKLYLDPSSLEWSDPREVKVLRGQAGKLGLRFKTVQSASRDTSNTVVVVVRETCVVQVGELKNLDRIQKINGIDLTNKKEDEVDAIFQDKKQSVFNLKVQSEVSSKLEAVCTLSKCGSGDSNSEFMDSGSYQPGFAGSKPKRMLSSSSGQASTCSVERPPTKRIVKSKSTDTDKSWGHHGDESCSPGVTHPLAPTHHLLDAAHIPDVQEYARTMSLPDRVSLAKIGIEIDDGERIHSLPVVNGSRPSARHGCDNGIGAVKLSVRRCKNKSCNVTMNLCLWHSLIFKVPQFVIWDPMSKTITLNRGTNASFGITKKVKIQEATSQIYTLVEAIEPGSVAASHDLFVGDWIQSINRHPLQRRDEAHRAHFDDLTEVRLVIQRPEGILQKAQEHADKIMKQQQLKPKMPPLKMPPRRGVSDVNFSPSPGMPMCPNSRPVLTSVSPVWLGPQGQHDPVERVVYWRHSDKQTTDGHGMSPSSLTCEPQFRGVTSPHSLEVWCKNCGNEAASNVSHHSPPHSPEDNSNPLYHQGSSSPTTPTDGTVPCSRVFICGNAANHLANMLMSGSPASTTIMQDTHTRLVKLSLKFDNSKVSVDIWQQRRNVPRDQHRVLNGTGYFSTSSGCVHCGADGASVNVELFVIQDDSFFHHSSHYLFTRDSLFIVAFDSQKILTNMSTDIARLEQLLHSIQSYVGNMAHIAVYGIFSLNDEEDKEDEVRTMFYANDRQHGKYSVSIPHIVFVNRSNVHETTGELCSKILMHSLSYGQKVLTRSQHVSEAVSSLEHESRTVWLVEELRQQISGHCPQHKDLILQADVRAELEQIGCLKPLTGKSNGPPKAVPGQDLFVHPISVYYRLVRLCIDSKDVGEGELMFNLSTRGVLLQSELSMLLHEIVPDVERFTYYLKTQGIVYDIGLSEIYEGNDRNIFIPYFLEELTTGGPKLTLSDVCLLVVFGGTTPWTIFYRLVAAFGQHKECLHVKFLRSGLCIISLRSLSIKLLFDNLKDTILITVERGSLSGKEIVVMQVLQQLLAHVAPPDLHYILGPPCPLQDCPPHIQGHVINLATPTIRCGHVCLNDHPNIKKWMVSENQKSGSASVNQRETTACLTRNILTLPPSVFREITKKLMAPLERDWRDLAGLLGKTTEEVMLYEVMLQRNDRLPSEQLLIDWNQMKQGSIGQLIAHLTEMERYDVRKIITDHLEIDMED
ncbi:uncharacterized protein LOC124146407 [Haliotis rufescens]|uniref:uncharacterized protein LOC124146407 n=1 Tax=Haliotis rufescens TaxID=6454 RepID=UPI001EB01118|nr:uncharacterized protein LOC124146407 [Haliotis rufescens]XP_046372631.1 uncharacterized protein LOC124146407 [Haliotis rufescens]XP_048257465.1 uncharacterized protein LOC124146407 [Haliotis rufescens]